MLLDAAKLLVCLDRDDLSMTFERELCRIDSNINCNIEQVWVVDSHHDEQIFEHQTLSRPSTVLSGGD